MFAGVCKIVPIFPPKDYKKSDKYLKDKYSKRKQKSRL